MIISINRHDKIDTSTLNEMYTLRARVFKGKKRWDVQIKDNKEIDTYDALNPYYMIIRKKVSFELIGCWRILYTTGPYMLKDIFPDLLHGCSAPSDDKTLELSRFIVCSDAPNNSKLSIITLKAIQSLVVFATTLNVSRLVTVTTVGVERMLIRSGISIARLGPPLQIGVEKTVALYIYINKETYNALFD